MDGLHVKKTDAELLYLVAPTFKPRRHASRKQLQRDRKLLHVCKRMKTKQGRGIPINIGNKLTKLAKIMMGH